MTAIYLKGHGSLPALGVAGSLHWTQLGSSPMQGDQPCRVPARSPRDPAGETSADFPHSQGREDNVLPALNVWPLSLLLLTAITITHVSLRLTEPKARTRLHSGSLLLVVLPAARSASLALQRLAHSRGSGKPCWVEPPPPPPWLMPPIYTRSKGAPFRVNAPYTHLLGNAPPQAPCRAPEFPRMPRKGKGSSSPEPGSWQAPSAESPRAWLGSSHQEVDWAQVPKGPHRPRKPGSREHFSCHPEKRFLHGRTQKVCPAHSEQSHQTGWGGLGTPEQSLARSFQSVFQACSAELP